LSPWKEIYQEDEQRTENFEEAAHYFSFIETVYKQSHEIVYVPQDTVASRISFIEDKLKLHG
jgi:predicted ATPase